MIYWKIAYKAVGYKKHIQMATPKLFRESNLLSLSHIHARTKEGKEKMNTQIEYNTSIL